MIAILLLTCANTNASHAKNVVLILTDDMPWFMFDDRQAMPNFNRLIRDQGKTFTHAYYYDALCCPSRATMLSGKYGHNHGVVTNSWKAFEDELNNTLAVWLEKAGVSSLEVGKFLNGYPGQVPPGWKYFASSLGLSYYGPRVSVMGKRTQYPETVYSTVLYTDLAISAIRNAVRKGDDFFLWLSFHAPHVPSTPERKFEQAFAGAKVPRLAPNQKTSASYDSAWRKMLQTTASVDEQVKRIFQTLRRLGELDQTYFIVLPDNGWMPGGFNGLGKTKSVPFDGASKIGLFVSGPGISKGKVDALVNNADIAPTIAELLGASAPRGIDGRSFAPLLTDGGSHARQVMPIFHKEGSAGTYPGYLGLRTKNLLYVERNDGRKLLFNSVSDPWQTKDVYAASSADLKRRLAERTAALAKCKGAECRRLEDAPL
jgi:arylsulfatase A-like enzyme